MIKLTGGTLGGRTLRIPEKLKFRPMAGILREALFNHLGSIETWIVLDGFAGAGTLGIEAISRGATHVTYLEIDPSHLAVINQNLEHLKVKDQATLMKRDVFRAYDFFATQQKKFDLVFFDPPYTFVDQFPERLLALLAQWRERLTRRGRLVFGYPSKNRIHESLPPTCPVLYQREFGNRSVLVLGPDTTARETPAIPPASSEPEKLPE